MVSAFVLGSSGMGLRPGRGDCVMLFGQTLFTFNKSIF